MIAAKTRVIELAGGRVEIAVAGSGKPVVWFHGVEGSLGWHAAMRDLADRATVYLPSLPGWDRSIRPEWLDTMPDLARYCLWLVEKLDAGPVTLAGHFLGGWLAAEMAALCPGAVDRLILVDAAGLRPRRGEIADIFLLGQPGAREAGFVDHAAVPEYAAVFEKEDTPEAREQSLANQEMAVRIGWKPYLHDRSLPYLLPRVNVPTLIVWGREDQIVPLECGEMYRDAIPNAQLSVIDRCGHYPHLEQPAEFVRRVSDFLAG